MNKSLFAILASCAIVLSLIIGCAAPSLEPGALALQPDLTAELDEANFMPIIKNGEAEPTAEPTADPTAEPTIAPTAEPTAEPTTTATNWTEAWIMNTTGETSTVFSGVEVNVTNVYTTTIDGKDYQCINATGIPNYETVIDQTLLDRLTTRPKGNEFNGSATPGVSLGDTVKFGESIGYTPAQGCSSGNEGYGYWPGGPACPTDQDKDWCFPLDPEPIAEGEVCSTALTQIGVWVNGVSSFDWQDGQSYNNERVWTNDAFHFEVYDLDICLAHSANGNYHHHSNPDCLGVQLGDDGSAASPIYGFSADGYPIYGPWESAGVLAQSCWKTRDYSAGSPTGCGVDGERSCLLVDQYDISQGVVDASSDGPSTSDTITSMSGNPILAVSGAYFEDYYYDPDCTAQGGQYLDEHNGHESAELGYHYHTTLTDLGNGEYGYAFPHYNGPTYAGVLQDNAIAQCSVEGGGPPGGGPPGGGGPP